MFGGSVGLYFNEFVFRVEIKSRKNCCNKVRTTYLPIFDSSSNSDGDLFVRLHNAAIIPVFKIRQQRKSIKMINNKMPPIAIPMIAADESTGESTRITRSEPVVKEKKTF